ncbi:MAG: hypothetical protein EPN97_04090 [Alphaproteobacteria bacterium]|nr:MAG: hypothetical protein EPN97_04090 [Alphaproteobacteria bacterium]
MGKYLGIKYNMSSEVHAILDRAKARIATVREQADWVVGHLHGHEGNQSYRFQPQHTMDDTVYVIAQDIELPPLYGEEALTLIIPRGVTVKHRALGDNRLYYMNRFEIENDPGHDIVVSPALAHELSKKRNLLVDDFVYAEAQQAALPPERTLGLIGEGHHAPGIFDERDWKNK